MNILIFSWRGPGHPNAGGAEISTHEHAKGWIKAGHKVVLFTSYFFGAKRENVIDGIEVKRYGRQMLGVQWEAFIWYLFKPHEKFDLVVDQFHGIPFFTPFYVRVKKMAFIHEVAKEVWHLNPWPKPYNYLPSIFGRLFEPFIFLLYRYIPFMTVSKSTKDDLIAWGIPDKNITVVHNGVTIYKLKKIPAKEKKNTLIYLGALSRDKGIESAFKVFSIINNTEDNWQFWVVGKCDPKYLRKLKALCNTLGLNRNIKFWDFVNEKKKVELLSHAHMAINPSIREGWGLVNIEANFFGLPVLAYNVAGSRDSIKMGINGFLSPLGDYQDMANKALKLMNDQNLYNKMQIKAKTWSRNFTWKKSVEESLKLIEGLVKK